MNHTDSGMRKKGLFRILAVFPIFILMAAGMGCGPERGSEGNRPPVSEKAGVSEEGISSSIRELKEYLQAAEQEWGFQGAVLVAKGDDVIYKTGVGAADVERNIPNTPGTKFLIASMTKVFTAAAVMKLVEAGKIRLDDPVVQHLPQYEENISRAVTILQVLSHSSGLPEFSMRSIGTADMTQAVDPHTLASSIRGKEPLFEPGQSSKYSNIGYILLGLVIENAAGISYEDWMRKNIIDPLELRSTGFCDDYMSAAGFARGYSEDGTGRLHPAPFLHLSWGYAAGALHSTVEDLYRWDRALASGNFLSESSVEEMFTPQTGSFGLGWLASHVFGRRSAAHGGGAPGFASWMERWPDDDVFVAVLSNITQSPAAEIGRSLAAVVFGEAFERPIRREALAVSPDVLKEFAGRYRVAGGDVSEILLDGESLYVQRQGARFPIRPYRRDCFFLPTYKGAYFRFIRGKSGEVTGYVSHEQGMDRTAGKVFR